MKEKVTCGRYQGTARLSGQTEWRRRSLVVGIKVQLDWAARQNHIVKGNQSHFMATSTVSTLMAKWKDSVSKTYPVTISRLLNLVGNSIWTSPFVPKWPRPIQKNFFNVFSPPNSLLLESYMIQYINLNVSFLFKVLHAEECTGDTSECHAGFYWIDSPFNP